MSDEHPHIQVFEYIEIFKLKLRWSKSSRLLQRIRFLVLFDIVYVGGFGFTF